LDIRAGLESRSNVASPLKKVNTLSFILKDLSVDRELAAADDDEHKTMAPGF